VNYFHVDIYFPTQRRRLCDIYSLYICVCVWDNTISNRLMSL